MPRPQPSSVLARTIRSNDLRRIKEQLEVAKLTSREVCDRAEQTIARSRAVIDRLGRKRND